MGRVESILVGVYRRYGVPEKETKAAVAVIGASYVLVGEEEQGRNNGSLAKVLQAVSKKARFHTPRREAHIVRLSL